MVKSPCIAILRAAIVSRGAVAYDVQTGGYMLRKVVTVTGFLTFSASGLFADFSYQEKSTITGGAMVSMLKVAGVFSKGARQAREPITSTVALKGDKMLHRSDQQMSIIDLG